jgi:adenylate kinase
MRILMIGPPGAGKGTQGALIAAHFDIPRIAVGDLLRDHVDRSTDLGRAVHSHLGRGELVPDEIMLCIVRQALIAAEAAGGGYVFDGVPRTMAQARAANKIAVELDMSADAAVHLRADDTELTRRLLARAVLEHRSDDTEQVIRHRLELYHQVTQPLIAWYSRRGILVSVDAMRPVGEVGRDILAALELKRPPSGQVRARARRPVDLTGLGAQCGQASGLWQPAAARLTVGAGMQRDGHGALCRQRPPGISALATKAEYRPLSWARRRRASGSTLETTLRVCPESRRGESSGMDHAALRSGLGRWSMGSAGRLGCRASADSDLCGVRRIRYVVSRPPRTGPLTAATPNHGRPGPGGRAHLPIVDERPDDDHGSAMLPTVLRCRRARVRAVYR